MAQLQGWFRATACVAMAGVALCGQAGDGNRRSLDARPYVQVEDMAQIAFEGPPKPDSQIGRDDLATLAYWRSHRTQADLDRANQSFFVEFRLLWGGDSPFPDPCPAEAQTFLDRIDGNIASLARAMKNRFMRPRPDQRDAFSDGDRKRGNGYSYPSTHAAISRTFALVLADLVPHRKAEFLARADGIAQDRVMLGVHYPSDLVAGKQLADLFHERLLQAPAYRTDLKRIRSLLKVPVTRGGAPVMP